jgi:hypothetical protein
MITKTFTHLIRGTLIKDETSTTIMGKKLRLKIMQHG